MARITVASAKQKGRLLQQWACRKISEVTHVPYTPGDDDSLIQSRPMGQSGNDCILRGLAAVKFPFAVECKSSEQWNLPKAIEQAKSNTKMGQNWLLVLKRKGKTPVVVLDADVFFEVMKRYCDYHD